MIDSLAIDLGATKVAFARVKSRNVFPIATYATPRSLKGFLGQLQFVISNEAKFEGITVAAAGVVQDNTVIIQSPNVNWLNEVPLASLLTRYFQLPSCVSNDMEALGVAEAEFGELSNSRCGLLETLSTGFGGCICFHLKGERVVIPCEPGHVVSLEDGPICGCGSRGCDEARFSGGAIRNRLISRFGSKISSDVDPCAYLDEAAHEGKSWALELYAEVGFGIGRAWANALNRNGWIERIVYSGTFGMFGMNFMLKHIQRVICERAMFPNHKAIPITESRLWPHGSLVGATIILQELALTPRS